MWWSSKSGIQPGQYSQWKWDNGKRSGGQKDFHKKRNTVSPLVDPRYKFYVDFQFDSFWTVVHKAGQAKEIRKICIIFNSNLDKPTVFLVLLVSSTSLERKNLTIRKKKKISRNERERERETSIEVCLLEFFGVPKCIHLIYVSQRSSTPLVAQEEKICSWCRGDKISPLTS